MDASNKIYIITKSVDSKTLEPTNQRIIGTRRRLSPIVLGYRLRISYADEPEMVRITTPIKKCLITDNAVEVETLNTIYTFEEEKE